MDHTEDMMDQGVSGALPQAAGLSPSVEPVPVSPPDGASIPNADEFSGYIVRVLGDRPEYLFYALTAVTRGMDRAIKSAEERAALKDQATLAAMALTQGRVGKELRETLLARIAAAIHPANQCGYERGYIDLYAKAEGH